MVPAAVPGATHPAPRSKMDWEAFFRDYRSPDFISGYRILNKLGSGVFGDVYRAEKLSIGKAYAIKFLRLQDERLREPVLRELEALDTLAQLDHPRLVSIEDRGEVHGIPFVVMGFAGDETLKTQLRGTPLSEERICDWFAQLFDGVAALHARGVVHFDLKPANVFLRGDQVRVGDYGLSRMMSASRATLSMGRGTPHYMAPEMLKRRGDARSDVYSLGVMLYEALVGEVPFTGDSEWEILKGHEEASVAFPEHLEPRWRSILERCLAKDPDDRFADAGALLAAFEEAARGAVIPPVPHASKPRATPKPTAVPSAFTPDGRSPHAGRRRHAPEEAIWRQLEEELDQVLHRARVLTGDVMPIGVPVEEPRWRDEAREIIRRGREQIERARGPVSRAFAGLGEVLEGASSILRGALRVAWQPIRLSRRILAFVCTPRGFAICAAAAILIAILAD